MNSGPGGCGPGGKALTYRQQRATGVAEERLHLSVPFKLDKSDTPWTKDKLVPGIAIAEEKLNKIESITTGSVENMAI